MPYVVPSQEDEDGHLLVLTIIQSLMTKAQSIFLDHFARLGIFSKVAQLAGGNEAPTAPTVQRGGKSESAAVAATGPEIDPNTEDAREILQVRGKFWS